MQLNLPALKQKALNMFDDMDKSGFGKLRRADVADNLLDLTDSAPHTHELIKGMHLDTEGTMSRTHFAKLYTMYHRDLAGEGPGAKGAMVGTMRQAAVSIEDKARRHRRQQYLCIRGSSALNSLSHTEAFKLSVVRVNSARRLRRIYEEMDADHNGRINSTDLKTYLEGSSRNLAKMATGIFNSRDRAGKGFMSFRDFLRMLYPSATRSDVTRLIKMAQDPQHRAHIDFSMQRKREIEAMFLSIDGNENKSGAISEANFLRGMQALGHSEEAAHDMFAAVDSDKSGTASMDEFLLWYESELQVAQGHGDMLGAALESDSDDEGPG